MYNMKNILGLSSNTLMIILIVAMLAFLIGKGACMNRGLLMEGMANPIAAAVDKEKKEDAAKKEKGSINEHFTAAANSVLGGGAKNKKPTEGFQVRQPLQGTDVDMEGGDSYTMTPWVTAAKKYAKGVGNTDHLNSYQYNTGTPIPLPEGELFLFAQNKFSPECCPSTYTSSTGCACMSQDQYNFLVTRGNNRNFPTEF